MDYGLKSDRGRVYEHQLDMNAIGPNPLKSSNDPPTDRQRAADFAQTTIESAHNNRLATML